MAETTIEGSRSRALCLVLLVGLAAILVACSGPPEVELLPTSTPGERPPPTATPTVEPPPPTTLLVCLAEEPQSLYLYGDVGRSADLILEALYDGPMDLLGFQYEPVLLEETPTLDGGGARLSSVKIAAGDVYLNPESLEPETLESGKPFLPTGCRSSECAQEYVDGEVEVEQLSVEFVLRPGVRWSDGEPLTAADSVYSFELQGDPDTPASKYLYARTFAYRALGETTVRWVGIPGFLDAEFAGNFWTPLPGHRLRENAPAELVQAPAAAETPIGWGPYQIEAWERGRRIVLVRNEEYSLGEGDPPFESVVFRFLSGDTGRALDLLRTGECDLLDERLLSLDQLPEARSETGTEDLALVGTPGSVIDRIDFNTSPAAGRPGEALMVDPRTRRALASCLDRGSLAQELFGEVGVVPDSFLPPAHPFYETGEDPPEFDPAAGRALLEEVGWTLEGSSATVRLARSVEGVTEGSRLSLTLLTLESQLAGKVFERVREDWANCGVLLERETLPAAELFAGWGEGPAFSRNFDAVLWGWPAFASPPCEMFAGWELPTADRPLGINASGMQDAVYDRECRTLLLSPPGTPAFTEAARRLQGQFTQLVPAIPLYARPQYVAHRTWLCGVEPNASATTVLWNIEGLRPCP